MKEQIILLRTQGKSYQDIQNLTGAAISTIRYHCDPHYKECARKRRNKSRNKRLSDLKLEFGGKCEICDYQKCLEALDFHHKEPQQKLDDVSYILNHNGYSAAKLEAKKCALICANCHREIHANLRKS